MIANLTGVVRDGSVPEAGDMLEPYEQDHVWPRSEAGTVYVTIAKQDGAPFDLTDAELVLTLRLAFGDEEPALAKAGDIGEGAMDGIGAFVIESDDTSGLVDGASYLYDVWATDEDGNRWQVVPVSKWVVSSIVSYPED